jgi:hypothetical protein
MTVAEAATAPTKRGAKARAKGVASGTALTSGTSVPSDKAAASDKADATASFASLMDDDEFEEQEEAEEVDVDPSLVVR